MKGKPTVKILNPDDREQVKRWENFVLKYGYIWYSARWIEVIHNTYKFKPLYLFIEEENKIVSTLPLFHVKGLCGIKNELVSLPHVETAGILNTSYLDLYLSFLSTKVNFKTLRIYQFREKLRNFPAKDINSIFILEIPRTQDELVKLIKKSKKRSFKKIKNPKITIDFSISEENINVFLHLLKIRMKELGTPWHKIVFYQEILRNFKEDLILSIAKMDNTSVGASLAVKYGDTCYSLYHIIPKKFQKLGISITLYFYLLDNARSNGLKKFCFGRSRKNTGPYYFKKEFGAKEYPIYIYSFRKKSNSLIPEMPSYIPEKYEWATLFIKNSPFFILNFISANLRKWIY